MVLKMTVWIIPTFYGIVNFYCPMYKIYCVKDKIARNGQLQCYNYSYKVKRYTVILLLPTITLFQLSNSSIYTVLYPTSIVNLIN